MLLLGIYNTITDNSPMLSTWKNRPKGKVEGSTSTSVVITWWATRLCAGRPSSSSTSEYSAKASNSGVGGGSYYFFIRLCQTYNNAYTSHNCNTYL